MTDTTPFNLRDPKPLGGAVVVWLYVYLMSVIANLAMVALEFEQLGGQSPAAAFTAGPGALRIEMMAGLTRGAEGLLFLVSGFLFLKWVYRVVANARTLNPAMRFTPGWAVGWYFVPLACWFKPFEYFKAAWEVSHNPASPAQVYTPSVLRWWWGLWIASSIAGNISFRLSMMDSSAGMQQASDVFEMLSDGLSIPLTLILVGIVRRLSDRQHDYVGGQRPTSAA